ncbi:arginine N-succinyltransferase [Parasphingopyxis lamellibrachiae]|uniref:Arginine succinyltransferase n=1 Tax=Parasphingopyxis lamellibrachiae TaxID=680125 RepID=A0A3D9FF92_9SPHN|nr:arginine N-succinyltransferase [Parasphingopyxis lamellibrachiae]RED15741.1 arginine succinyltransferase [Parasphingopyxis lamellibrachiae]
MNFVVRAARRDDVDQLYEMAKLTGGGFTNLPPDRGALDEKLARSEEAFAKTEGESANDLFLLALENTETGHVRGTAQIFAAVGKRWPFYSYRINTFTQHSKELERTFTSQILSLTTDYEGASEVGGLFLHPNERAGGLGMLLARSRYLFIAKHRARFGDKVIAELRGVIDEAGGSAFWDALAGKFFGMSFQEADEFNARNGHQFIADLMPKHPIYLNMLPESARSVIGKPHPSGRAAMRMLEKENFKYTGYIDIFDGGPTMEADIDSVRSVANSHESTIASITETGDTHSLAATGTLESFRCCYAQIEARQDGEVGIDENAAAILEAQVGTAVRHVPR